MTSVGDDTKSLFATQWWQGWAMEPTMTLSPWTHPWKFQLNFARGHHRESFFCLKNNQSNSACKLLQSGCATRSSHLDCKGHGDRQTMRFRYRWSSVSRLGIHGNRWLPGSHPSSSTPLRGHQGLHNPALKFKNIVAKIILKYLLVLKYFKFWKLVCIKHWLYQTNVVTHIISRDWLACKRYK